jgi:hypothetical protein
MELEHPHRSKHAWFQANQLEEQPAGSRQKITTKTTCRCMTPTTNITFHTFYNLFFFLKFVQSNQGHRGFPQRKMHAIGRGKPEVVGYV